jgi:hypothetical protein
VSKRRKHGPRQQAVPGELWVLDVGGEGVYTMFALCVGELDPRTGNYPLLLLDCCGVTSTKPGSRMNAALTTARWWRKLDP